MKSLSAEESLWLALPVLIVLIGLIAVSIFLPKNNLDDRSRASEPKTLRITPTIKTKLETPTTPEVICTAIYAPVCGSNNKTYSNTCEAGIAGIIRFTQGACKSRTPVVLPQTN